MRVSGSSSAHDVAVAQGFGIRSRIEEGAIETVLRIERIDPTNRALICSPGGRRPPGVPVR